MTENMQPVAGSEARAHALKLTEGPLDPTWQEERWSKGSVEVGPLRTTQTDFRLEVKFEKHVAMKDILERSQGDILAGTFPCAEWITAEGNDIPAVMLERDDTGRLFVADGQARVFKALWHRIERIDAYVFHRPGVRKLP